MSKIEKILYTISLLLVCAALLYARYEFNTLDIALGYGVKWAALGAVFGLYTTLLIGPLYAVFPTLPGKTSALVARKALGKITFLLALLHGGMAFFGLLGGFRGWLFLSVVYQWATIFGLGALCILLALFVVSFKPVATKVFSRIPYFGKIGYIAGLLTIIHALLIGTHFRNLHTFIPQLSFVLVGFLVLMLAITWGRALSNRFQLPGLSLLTPIVVSIGVGIVVPRFFVIGSNGTLTSSGLHAQHMASTPGATAVRYSSSVSVQSPLVPRQEVTLEWRIFNADTAEWVKDFATFHDKIAHLVIVNDSLSTYQHLHPELHDGILRTSVVFPDPGGYRMYLSVEPLNAQAEQVFATAVQVGTGLFPDPLRTPDAITAKQVSGYSISLIQGARISKKEILAGTAKIVFHVTNAEGAPAYTLYPYLAAFGHLVMIHTSTYSYIHVHPKLTPFGPEDTSGPDVEFMLAGSVEPGIYRLFAQFSPNKELITVPFTIEVTP